MQEKSKIDSINQYIQMQNKEVQTILNELHKMIKAIYPNVEERINYSMPTYVFNKNKLHIAVNKKHIGLYPGPYFVEKFIEKHPEYEFSKGTIKIPLNNTFPFEVVKSLVEEMQNEPN